MQCQDCGMREATTRIKENINGRQKEIHLCYSCFVKINSAMFANVMPIRLVQAVPKCSKCGTSVDTFSKTAFLGCANCYYELAEAVIPYVKRVQYDLKHRGKTPSGITAVDLYNKLKNEYERAVSEGRIDDASELRIEMNKAAERRHD